MFVCSPQKYWDVHDTQLQSSCSPSPCTTQTRTGSVAAGLEIILNPMFFMQLPTPGQRREYSSDKRRFRGSIKAEMRRFFARIKPACPGFPAWRCRFNRSPDKFLFADQPQCLISTLVRSGLSTSCRNSAAGYLLRCQSLRRAVSVGRLRFHAATDRKLTDRTLDVEVDTRHLREQINIGDPNRASAQPQIVRHQVECLHQCAGILENERIGDRAVLP